MLMHHPDATEPVDVHLSQIAAMTARGWSEKPPVKAQTKPKPKDKNNGTA